MLALVAGMTGLAAIAFPQSAFATYNGGEAAAYADHWWNGRNSNYYTFSDDCTNFVSQALHDPYSGGGFDYVGDESSNTDDTQWWMHWDIYNQYFTWSHSWSVANDLYTFLMVHYPGGYYEGQAHSLTEQQATYTPDSVVTGDVLFYDFNSNGAYDHASIQVGIGTDTSSGYYGNYEDQHSNDRYHAFWSLLPYNGQWASTTITYVHVAASNT